MPRRVEAGRGFDDLGETRADVLGGVFGVDCYCLESQRSHDQTTVLKVDVEAEFGIDLLAHPGSGSTILKLVKFPSRNVEVQRPLG